MQFVAQNRHLFEEKNAQMQKWMLCFFSFLPCRIAQGRGMVDRYRLSYRTVPCWPHSQPMIDIRPWHQDTRAAYLLDLHLSPVAYKNSRRLLFFMQLLLHSVLTQKHDNQPAIEWECTSDFILHIFVVLFSVMEDYLLTSTSCRLSSNVHVLAYPQLWSMY